MLEIQILDYAHVKKGSRNKRSEKAPFSSLCVSHRPRSTAGTNHARALRARPLGGVGTSGLTQRPPLPPQWMHMPRELKVLIILADAAHRPIKNETVSALPPYL